MNQISWRKHRSSSEISFLSEPEIRCRIIHIIARGTPWIRGRFACYKIILTEERKCAKDIHSAICGMHKRYLYSWPIRVLPEVFPDIKSREVESCLCRRYSEHLAQKTEGQRGYSAKVNFLLDRDARERWVIKGSYIENKSRGCTAEDVHIDNGWAESKDRGALDLRGWGCWHFVAVEICHCICWGLDSDDMKYLSKQGIIKRRLSERIRDTTKENRVRVR